MTSSGAGIYDTPLAGPCPHCGVYYTGLHDCTWTRQQQTTDPVMGRIAAALERIAEALEYPR